MSAFNKDELRIVGHLVKLGYVKKSNRYVIAADLAHEERLYRDKVKKLSKDDKSKLREKEKMNLQTSKIEFNTGKSQEQKDKEMKQKEELGVLDRCKKAREAKKTKSDAKSSDAEPADAELSPLSQNIGRIMRTLTPMALTMRRVYILRMIPLTMSPLTMIPLTMSPLTMSPLMSPLTMSPLTLKGKPILTKSNHSCPMFASRPASQINA